MRTIAIFLVCGVAAAQSPEAGRIVRSGNEARLLADSPRPLDSAAITLSEQLGVLVNTEDPLYLYKDDIGRDEIPSTATMAARADTTRGSARSD